jgi:acyl dehydratase
MGISMRHVLEQGPMLRTLGGAALTALKKHDPSKPKPAVPGPWIEATAEAPSAELIRAFVKNSGGDPSSYRGVVPPHLFPQWAMPVAFKAIATTPYPLTRVMNAGCRFEQKEPLPAGERLTVRARLESIDDDGKRAILTTRLVTGTASAPEALVSEIHAFVPLARKGEGGKGKGEKKLPVTVPIDAHELAFVRLGAKAGLDFAKLTGDFNPIHWVPAYARASGFRSTILHGFGTFALAIEAVVRRSLSGDIRSLVSADARFTKPLVLPGRVGVYVSHSQGGEHELFVGSAPGAPAYLTGHFATQGDLGR